MTISNNAQKLLSQRYLGQNETFGDMVNRVIENTVQSESKEFKNSLWESLSDRVFLPNSPCLFNAGTKTGGLFACFVVGPTQDNVENHVETLGDIAMVAKKGGGCGYTGTFIRPKGYPVAGSTHGYAYGPNAWSEKVSTYMDMMTQTGKRGMALMYTLSADHDDLEDFIDLKQTGNESHCHNFNQSIMASDSWVDAALTRPASQEGRLFTKIIENMWNNGEPGFLFSDRMNSSPYAETGQTIYATNPCGEQPLPPYGSCNLGSINVSHEKFVKLGEFNFDELEKQVRILTRFLDSVGSANKFPNYKFEKWYSENRPIGIGVMGFADLLLKLSLAYGESESLNLLSDIMRLIQETSYNESEKLGKEKGIPEKCKPFGRRNITTVSIAPTGSIAILADCSHSLEPVFSPEFVRTDFKGETYLFPHPYAKNQYFRSAVNNEEPEKIVTWKQHIDVQSAAQKYCDSGVSKTINFPRLTTVETMYNAAVYASRCNIKGITFYRDGSRNFQPVSEKSEPKKIKDESVSNECPTGICEI